MLIISPILPYSSNTSSSIAAIHFIITLQMLKEKHGKVDKQMHMIVNKRVKRMCTVLQKIIFYSYLFHFGQVELHMLYTYTKC